MTLYEEKKALIAELEGYALALSRQEPPLLDLIAKLHRLAVLVEIANPQEFAAYQLAWEHTQDDAPSAEDVG